jgi:predicted dehydrogenase
MKTVRFGVIGLGYMGMQHAHAIVHEGAQEFCLGAVADANPKAAARAGEELSVPAFTDPQQLLECGRVDAVLIVAPHYLHAPLTIRAARAGIHVLCEKPMAVEIGAARLMVDACRQHGVALGCMLQMRRRPVMMRIKQMIQSGELGRIYQATLVCSNWYRTQAYYDSGSWRGTWAGEGGGILTNQAPHQLDTLSWFLGRPNRVAAFLNTRLHQIEVENTANVLYQYDDGKAASLYFTTAENPRREQLRICGDRATIQLDGAHLRIGRLAEPVSEHIHNCKESGADQIPDPNCTWEDVALEEGPKDLRLEVIRAFARHLCCGEPMVVTGQEAADEVEMANAIYLAGFGRQVVELPLDPRRAAQMSQLLDQLVQSGRAAGGPNLRDIAAAELAKLHCEQAELAGVTR